MPASAGSSFLRTPTSRSAAPIAADMGVPYLAPFTGAEFLRDRAWRNVINLRASYYQETEAMVSRLIGDLGIDRVGVVYQDDSFGQAGFRGPAAVSWWQSFAVLVSSPSSILNGAKSLPPV